MALRTSSLAPLSGEEQPFLHINSSVVSNTPFDPKSLGFKVTKTLRQVHKDL